MAIEDIIVLDAPSEQISVADQEWTQVKGGLYRYTVAFNTLGQGKTERELAGGVYGFVKYLSLSGELSNIKTREPLGKCSLKVFLNTKVHYTASSLAAVTGCYDPVTKRSRFVPVRDAYSNGDEFYKVQEINGKSFIVALLRTDDYVTASGETIPQFDVVGVLADTGVNAKHYIDGVEDRETKVADYKALMRSYERAVARKKEREAQLATQAVNAGAGVGVYGVPPAQTAQPAQMKAQASAMPGVKPVPSDEIPF